MLISLRAVERVFNVRKSKGNDNKMATEIDKARTKQRAQLTNKKRHCWFFHCRS